MEKKTVLYAEDDENDVFFMQRAFAKLKLRDALHVASNGRAATDWLAGTGKFSGRRPRPVPDLLLLDIKMPEMSGLEVLSWVRQQRKFDALPIVLFTSSTQKTDIVFCRQHGANGYWVKPSNAENLSELIAQILEGCARPGAGCLDIEGNRIAEE